MSIRITPRERGFRLETEQVLPCPREELFPFFADAANLGAITPKQLRFRILTPLPITMAEGALIDYQLRINGVPVRWQTEITAWDPPFRFADSQRRGPYSWWVHEHEFIDEDGATRMIDRVDYGVPGGAIVHRLVVRRQLAHIFGYRREVLERRFGNAVASNVVAYSNPS